MNTKARLRNHLPKCARLVSEKLLKRDREVACGKNNIESEMAFNRIQEYCLSNDKFRAFLKLTLR